MDKILKKDIVIPAGTVFSRSARTTTRCGDNFYMCVLGLSQNTSGSFEYCIDDDLEVLNDYFEDE